MNTRDAVEAGGRSFFVALPDTPRASALAARLAQVSTTRITHHSGRPWLLGHLTTDRLVTAQVGRTTAAIVGRSDATESRLRRLADDISVPAQAAAAASNFHGSYTTIVSVDGQIYASAAAMETRRIWSARIDGVLVLSDRADVLADLGEFDVDPAAVTIRLLGTMPHPLDRVPLWAEVEPLAGDRYITVDRNGERSRTGTWWYAPQADTSRSDGAVLFRSAVEGSVRARTAPGDPVACDLSGGLDSTPLCYFAAQAQQGVLARTLFNDDPGGREDLHWARRAIKSMPGVHTHEVTSTDDMQDFYEGVDSLDVRLDEPTQAATAGPRIVRMLADDRRKGIRTHITGLGGDHILRGVNAWEHTIVRARPWVGWNRARAQHIPAGIGVLTTVRELADRRTYRQWFADTMSAALAGAPHPEIPRMNDWSSPPAVPPWLTPHARELLRSKIDSALDAAEPLDRTVAGHIDLYFARDAARLIRGTAQLGQPFGVSYDSPLLDDRVVEAALAVRRDERDTPLEWKPLMKDAMRGLLPNDYLMRTNKIGGGPQSVRGYARHYGRLLELMDDARLFDTGLVDRTEFVASTSPRAREVPVGHVHQAINASVFLAAQRNRTDVTV
ncbi:MAG: asparagine synthase-related protein [Rhodococcus sp. (in: high G+C Gram-positive bacteria)]|uniref:asparagine synthase-related protein n=1 Tax=unclassified Rhodococcus (in: high G+C Gram-positive bacteria) TaxID=192944 RepID=UPI000EF87CD3|nr:MULTISPECIES: asparagine synthase-related protein [unclassified Rhodococcus (in: high G+C Gram-positive bacteria)]RMB78283.1 asparagine synthase [Rhodococcus sp. SBT000017]